MDNNMTTCIRLYVRWGWDEARSCDAKKGRRINGFLTQGEKYLFLAFRCQRERIGGRGEGRERGGEEGGEREEWGRRGEGEGEEGGRRSDEHQGAERQGCAGAPRKDSAPCAPNGA